MKTRVLMALASTALLASSCLGPRGSSPDAKREYVADMRQEALSELYRRNPQLKARVESAPGYAVFSNISGGVLFVSTGQGYGVAHDNRSGRDIYMKMAELGAGLGIGLKHFRAIFVFNDAKSFRSFVDTGLEFGADADVALAADGSGVSAGASGGVGSGGATAGGSASAGAGSEKAGSAGSAGSGVEIYQLTESGIVLRGGVAGTKYWKDSELN